MKLERLLRQRQEFQLQYPPPLAISIVWVIGTFFELGNDALNVVWIAPSIDTHPPKKKQNKKQTKTSRIIEHNMQSEAAKWRIGA